MNELFEELVRAARRRPHAAAITFLDRNLAPTAYSYDQLFARVREIQARLAALNLPPRLVVGILAASQESQVLHYLAALGCGLTPALLTPANRKLNREYYLRSMEAMLRSAGLAALITDTPVAGTPTFSPYTFEPNCAGRPDASCVAPEGTAFLQFSSGTTGLRKGVLVEHAAMLSQLNTYASAVGLGEDDCVVSWLPLYHDMGFVACLNAPLLRGAHAVIISPLDWVANPAMYLRAVSAYRGTWGFNPNFAYAFMAERIPEAALNGVRLDCVKGLVNCAELVTASSQNRFLDRFRPLGLRDDVFVGCYAMAETTFALTHGRMSDPGYIDLVGVDGLPPGAARVSVGRALPGVDLLVTDPDGGQLEDRQLGELQVRSAFNATGYYRNAEASSAFRDGWYRTGDLGYRVGDDFFVCGRIKDVLILSGVNVLPEDLEAIVGQVSGIQPGRVAAFSQFDPSLQTERATILAEWSEAFDGDKGGLVVEAQQKLLSALQISNFAVHLVPSGWLIKSSSGKIARSANKEKWVAAESLHQV